MSTNILTPAPKAEKSARRGPGRPPSKPAPPALEQRGIVLAPLDANNRLEFVYNDPSVFKSLFTYFKNIKARDIHLRCNPAGLTFFARDHSKTSRVVAHVAIGFNPRVVALTWWDSGCRSRHSHVQAARFH